MFDATMLYGKLSVSRVMLLVIDDTSGIVAVSVKVPELLMVIDWSAKYGIGDDALTRYPLKSSIRNGSVYELFTPRGGRYSQSSEPWIKL